MGALKVRVEDSPKGFEIFFLSGNGEIPHYLLQPRWIDFCALYLTAGKKWWLFSKQPCSRVGKGLRHFPNFTVIEKKEMRAFSGGKSVLASRFSLGSRFPITVQL